MKPGDLVIHYDSSGCTPPEPVLLMEICENFMDDLTGARVMNELGVHWVPISDIVDMEDWQEGDVFDNYEEED